MKHFTSIISLFILNLAVAFSGNKIYYVTTDNQPITPNAVEMGVHIISNTYSETSDIYPEGCWTLEFDRDITTVDGFNALTTLKSIVLPEGIITIGSSSFRGCSNLQEINIPYGVTSIGGSAFNACDLRKTVIPASVKRIGYHAFIENSHLANVELPETRIEEIGYDAFKGTMWWSNYSADEKNIYGNIVYIYDIAYQAVSLDITECTIKEGTRMIADRAFAYCSKLQKAHIPNGVESIGYETFYECDLKKVVIPKSVKRIGRSAFSTNTWLTEVELPETIEEIGAFAFGSTMWWINYYADEKNIFGNILYIYDIAYKAASYDITECTFKDCTRTIAEVAFAECNKLTQVTIPNGITKIGDATFSDCKNLKEITIPESVTEIGAKAFKGCDMKTIDLPQNITHIGEGAFQLCRNLKKIALPRNITRIESSTFENCSSLTEVVIPDGVNYIGSGAFASCQALEEITLPASLEFIGHRAFYLWYNRRNRFYCNASAVPTTASDAFNVEYLKYYTLFVPGALKADYKATYPWSEFGGIYNIDGSDDIQDVSVDAAHDPLQKWDLNGRELVQPAKGQIYLHQGRKKIVR